MDTEARMAIFAIVENNHGMLLSGDRVVTYMQWCWVGYVGPIRVN